MVNSLVRWCLANRATVIILYSLFIILGFSAVKNTPVDAIPDIGENQQVVFSEWPGRSPKDIEDQITYPLSVALQGLPGVKTIRASSAFGFSMIYIIFEDHIDFYWSRTRVMEKLSVAQKELPRGVVPELGPDATGLGQVFWYTIEGPGRNLAELRSIQDWYVRYQLQSVAGVSEVAGVGGYIKQYQIDIDPVRLSGTGLNIADVFKAVKKSNIDVGAKVLEEGKMEFLVRGVGFIKNVEDIEYIVIGEDAGVPIYVKNVGSVTLGPEFRRNALDKNGREAVGGVAIMRYGENPREVIERIKEKLESLQSGLPKGVRIVPFYDRTELIDRTVSTLISSLSYEIFITIIVIFLFLRVFATSVIVSLTLPLAVLASLSAMHMFGMSSNIMSLSGIIIAIGTMVDMGIILAENIVRHLNLEANRDRNKSEIILQASREVGPAVVTAILTTIVSFLPVFALEGQEGKLFHPLAYTKSFALVGSIFVTLTLVPVLASLFLKKTENYRDRELWITKFYRTLLSWNLQRRSVVVGFTGLLILSAGFALTKIGREFMPPLNEGDILFMPVMLPSVSLTEALRVMKYQDEKLKTFPEVKHVVGKLGRAETATDPAPVSMFETVIGLKPKEEWRAGVTRESLISEMNSALKIPGVANIWTQPIANRVDMLSTGIRTQVGVKVFGNDLATLEKLASDVETVLREVPGAVDLYSEKIVGKPYVEIEVDRQAIARYGAKIQDVQEVIQTAVGGMNLTQTVEGRERYPVRIRYHREYRNNVDALKRVLVPTPSGAEIPLGQLTSVKKVMGPAMINSENGMLRAYVLLNVRGRDMIGFVEDAAKVVDEKVVMPPGYYLSWSGQFENQVRARKKLSVLVPLSLLINFLILFFSFKNVGQTLIIFLAIPVSLAGGVLLLWVSGFNISVAVWVGFIALFGIAVDAGVVLIAYLNQTFEERQPKTKNELIDCVIDASSLRIRPVVMTSLTTIVALIPILAATGSGSEVMKPMAIPTIGGMTVLFLTLFLVPICYAWIEERKLGVH